jgi:hypothetical protein
MPEVELAIEPIVSDAGQVVAAARLSPLAGLEPRIWFTLDDRYRDTLTPRADPFVLVTLAYAMRDGFDIRVRGAPISAGLRPRLTELMKAWQQWRGYEVVEIDADEMPVSLPHRSDAVTAFSGGIDSAFTALRHAKGRSDAGRWPLRAGLMVHGFDIPLDDPAGFGGAAARSAHMLTSLNLDLITVATNARQPNMRWHDAHGLCLGAALSLVSGRFRAGLIASSATYLPVILPWGSNPISDPLMGSDDFEIVHDGLDTDRYQKVAALARWPEAQRWLRVCYDDPRHDQNCGRCRKCVGAYLMFRVAGVEPEFLGTPIRHDDIMRAVRLRPEDPFVWEYRRALLAAAEARGTNEPWVHAMRRSTRRQVWVLAYRSVRPDWMRGQYGRVRAVFRRLRRRLARVWRAVARREQSPAEAARGQARRQ